MPNLISTPRKWRSKLVLFKSEATYATDPLPTAAANWIEARNVSFTPFDPDKQSRNIELPYLGNAGDIVVGKWAKLSFDFALVASGTLGTAPKWGALLLSCAMSETVTAATSVAYNVVTSGFGSATIYMNIDGVLHKMVGCRGSVKLKLSAQGLPMATVSFDAIYSTPTSTPITAVTRTGWQVEEGVNSANTAPAAINGVNLPFSELEFDLGLKTARVDLPGPQLGIEVQNRNPTASITVLAPDLATFNPFALCEQGTVVPVSATHGSSAGKKVKADLQARIMNVEYDRIQELVAYKLTLDPVPVAGNDEFVLTCL